MDRDDRRSSFVAYMIVIEFTGLLFSGCLANPQFKSDPTYVQFHENSSTKIGTLLFNLTATDNDRPSNTMTIYADDTDTNMYVSVNQTRSNSTVIAAVYLKKILDRESTDGVMDLKFFLNDATGNTIRKSVKLYILDECDEPPQYDRPSYTLEINETDVITPTIVFTKIHATDKDNGLYAVVTYTMKPKAESEEWEQMYSAMFTIDPGSGSVILMRNLDYEKNSFYQYTLYAHDTCNLTADSADFLIKVKDVQDTPPFFVGLPYIRNIMEGTRDNKVLLPVRALDGDRGIPNAIYYVLSTTIKICQDHFIINASTGDIVFRGALDWGMEELWQIHGVCIFIVEAREMDKHPGNQKGKTVSSTTVTIAISRSITQALNLQPCVYNAMNCSCICTEHQSVRPNIVG